MISYIKEYGVINMDYEFLIHNLKSDTIELLILSENSVREVLEYYNSLGIREDIVKIIINRPDLVLIPKVSLEQLISNIDEKLFVNLVHNSIEDLILFGI